MVFIKVRAKATVDDVKPSIAPPVVIGSAVSEMIARSTASGWVLCVIGITGVFALFKILAGQRPQMREMEIKRDAAEREADEKRDAEIRAFFSTQIGDLRSEILALRQENTALRAEIRELHGVIDGMSRQATQVGISTQRAVVESLPRDIVPQSTLAALDRIDPTIRDAAE